MVYLLGINHRLQWDREYHNTSLLESYIKKKIKKHKIEILAEEFSKEIFNDRFYSFKNIHSTPIEDISLELDLKHIYCDPHFKKREELGIRRPSTLKQLANIEPAKFEKDYTKEEHARFKKERKKDDDIREMYWLSQILDFKDKKIMFICGIQHLDSFKKKLQGSAFKVITFKEIFDALD